MPLFASVDAERRGFAVAHFAGGAVGLGVAIAWLAQSVPSNLIEWIVLGWLMSPLALATVAMRGGQMGWVQLSSSINTITLLGVLSFLTGGLSSLFLPWLILVPAEAALARRPFVLAMALFSGIATVFALWAFGQAGSLPPSIVQAEWASLLAASSIVGCLIYAGALAIEVQRIHVRAAAKVAESEASYRFLAENAADPILRLTPSGELSFASPSVMSVIGQMPDALLGKTIYEFVHDEDVAAVRHALVRSAYFAEEMVVSCRLRSVDEAEVAWLELHCRPVRKQCLTQKKAWPFRRNAAPAHNRGMDIIAIARDVTAQRKHEAELKRAYSLAEAQSKAKSRFLANMSHELRTPLNSVLGFAEMISQEIFGPVGCPRYREYAQLIGESGNHLLDLINDILDVSKIEAGKYELYREPLNLAETLERTLRLMMPQFREKGVHLGVDVAADLPLIDADSRAVRQVLFNLMSNALKFTPPGGRANIALTHEGDAVVLSVSDTGIGIAPADLKRLARPFEQAQGPDVRKQVGTGLGLSLVRGLTTLHGGTLNIKSRLGYGTTISVRLPLGIEEKAIAPLAVAEAA